MGHTWVGLSSPGAPQGWGQPCSGCLRGDLRAGLPGAAGTSAGSCPGLTTAPWNVPVFGKRGWEVLDMSPGCPGGQEEPHGPGLSQQMDFRKLRVSNPHFKLLNAFSSVQTGLTQLLNTVISNK